MNQLLHFDQVVVRGVGLNTVDGSVVGTGLAGWEATAVTSSMGDDFSKRARVPRTLRMQVQFGPEISPEDLRSVRDEQITARDSQSGRRMLANRCTFGSMGEVGAGPVDVTFLVLSEPQWL
jgi:hypothetical protein